MTQLGTVPVIGVSGTASSQTPVPAQITDVDFPKHRWYSITASLREQYDSNLYTAKTNQVSSFETSITPALLIDYPTENSSFSMCYTFNLITYYNPGGGSNYNTSNNLVARYQHAFSDRFSFDVSEQFSYTTEPSFFDSVGTLYRNGAYLANTVTMDFNAQWTPLISTTSTYSNTVVRYQDSSVATEQDSIENTGSQSIGFAILPKINLIFGGIVDNISYDQINRGYTSLTGNTGIDWQALPSLSLGVRVGGSVTTGDNTGSNGVLVSPYGAVTLHWKLGARSSLGFDYAHATAPTDVFVANGQTTDRFASTFSYDVSRSITVHVQGILTHAYYPSQLLVPGTVQPFNENDYAINLGLSYHLNNHFDFETGYTFSGVSSGLSFRDYSRNQAYVGVRGTY